MGISKVKVKVTCIMYPLYNSARDGRQGFSSKLWYLFK